MTHDHLLVRASETNAAYLALGNERFEAFGSTFISNPRTPRRHDANAMMLVRAGRPDEIEDLLKRFEQEYAALGHRMVNIDPLTPPSFEARLTLEDGYKPNDLLVLLLEGDLNANPRPIEIREVLSETDWAAYMELDRLWWLESGTGDDAFGPYDPDLHAELMLNLRLKSPATRRWLACVEGIPRAFFSAWPGDNGVGIVEDLFCHPEYRHRGLATALMAHCVKDARARGAGPILINSDPKDTPRRMYAAMGFRPFYVSRTYTKRLPS
jgi:GNAT superfamily N-acetyltransferase